MDTFAFTTYVPQTKGYFNIGESVIYITALFFGPVEGRIADGVGSMFADNILGYSAFVPRTLATKAGEGAVSDF